MNTLHTGFPVASLVSCHILVNEITVLGGGITSDMPASM